MKKKILLLCVIWLTMSCWLSLQAQDLNYQWAKKIGGQQGNHIALDALNNIYMVGVLGGSNPDFDPSSNTANLTGSGIFVAKYSNNGDYIWAFKLGSSGDASYELSLDASGNVYVVGDFFGTVDFDPSSNTANLTSSGQNTFIAKYNSNGQYIWAKLIGSKAGYAISIDVSSNVYILGAFDGISDFDPSSGVSTLTGSGEFIAKYNTDGEFIWVKNIGGSYSDHGRSLDVDSQGNVFIATGFFDILFAKYDTNGEKIWEKSIGGSLTDQVRSIVIDTQGNLYLLGFYRSTVDFDPSTGISNLTSIGNADIFFAKYNTNGEYLFAKSIGGNVYDEPRDISLDNDGSIYLTGYLYGTVDFDTGGGVFNLSANGDATGSAAFEDIFIAKYDINGGFIWASKIGGTSNDGGESIVLDASNNIYLTGYFQGNDVDFNMGSGTANLSSNSSNINTFIAKYSQSITIPTPEINLKQNTTSIASTGSYDFGAFTVSQSSGNITFTIENTGNAVLNLTGTPKIVKSGTNVADFTVTETLPATINASSSATFTISFTPSGTGTRTAQISIANNDSDENPYIINLTGVGNTTTQSLNYEWANSIGSTSGDEGRSIAVDASGNIYVTGNFEGTVDFDPSANTTNLTSAGQFDMFIAKYTNQGNLVWAKALGGTLNDFSAFLKLDALDNIYITGGFFGTADFDPSANTANLVSLGDRDIFMAKYNSSGEYVWAKGFGSTGTDQANSLTFDNANNIYLTGYFTETTDFDPSANTANLVGLGNRDIFIAKYNNIGDYVWAKSIGGTNPDISYEIAIDTDQNIYVTGYFTGTVDFDPSANTANFTSVGVSNDIFLAKYDGSGNYIWAKAFGATGLDWGRSLKLDASNNVYLTGHFFDTVDFDPSANTANLISLGGDDILIAKYSTNGEYIWAKSMGGSNPLDLGVYLALDTFNNLYITGRFSGVADFDPSSGNAYLTSAGDGDVYIAKYNSEGEYIWAGRMGGLGLDFGFGLVLDASSNVYATGLYRETTDFDMGIGIASSTSAGNQDMFIAKYSQIIPSPEINLKQNTTSIASSGSYDFGALTVSQSSGNISFTIENTGNAVLNLTGTPKIVKSGTNAADFTITETLPTSINAGATASFTINFTPSSTGTRTAQISIANNDSDENPYIINLIGTGNAASPQNQTITFTALSAKTFGDAPFALTATASSGLAVSYTSSNTAVATISGNTVTIVGAGTTTITASQAGNVNYNAATNVTQDLVVNKANQTITFTALSAKTFGDASFALTATASSGLAVSYTSSNTAVATVSGNTVTIVGAGTTTITASQSGNVNYNPATNVTQDLVVNKANQTITFTTLSAKTFGDASFALTATASSGLAVSYTSSNTAVATISGNTVTIVGAGTTTITASQAGNVNYNAATNVTQDLVVNKANQSITFAALSAKTFGDAPFALTATASSGLAVSYTSSNTAVATISGNTVTIVGAGTTTITASQAGNSNYNAATNVTQDLVVNKANQTITFTAPSAKTFGDAPFTLSATSSSGLAVSYTSSNTNVATISGNTVTIVGAGTTTITASQAGNSNYNAATNVTQDLVVNKANQTITFTCPPNQFVFNTNNNQIVLGSASATSGLPVTFGITTVPSSGVATLSGSTITVQSVGNITVSASVASNANYNAATSECPAIVVQISTALEDDALAAGTQIFPNPSNGLFKVKVTLTNLKGLQYHISDIQGRELQKGDFKQVSDGYETEIDLRKSSAATYLLKISTADGRKLTSV